MTIERIPETSEKTISIRKIVKTGETMIPVEETDIMLIETHYLIELEPELRDQKEKTE